jgi:hypothetical protein
MAYASVHQFTQALTTGGETTMPASDDITVDTTTHPQVAKAKKRNAIAMATLTMPDDVITKVELRHMLGKVKMKKDDEPSILFEQLSAIEK